MPKVPGSNPSWAIGTLSKITKFLFLIEDISELECWHLVSDAWFLGCSGNAPGLRWKCLGCGGKAPGLQWKCLGCSGNGSLSKDWNPGSIMGNDIRGRENTCPLFLRHPLSQMLLKLHQEIKQIHKIISYFDRISFIHSKLPPWDCPGATSLSISLALRLVLSFTTSLLDLPPPYADDFS